MCQILSPCLRVGAPRDRHPQAVCRIQDLTMLYAKLFLPVGDCIGTEARRRSRDGKFYINFLLNE